MGLFLLVVGSATVLVVISWLISVQRRLLLLNENVTNAMSQIGIQISSRFDALGILVELGKAYAELDCERLIATLKKERKLITANSTPDDVIYQEQIICETLARIIIIAEQYPELKGSQKYARTMDTIESLEKMVRTSCIVYNDSVAKLSYEGKKFPVSIVASRMRLVDSRQ